MSTILDMDVATVPLERVTPYPGNARQGDITAIADSLAVNGQYRPLVVQRSTGHVLCGNNTLAAAHTLGWTEIAVQYIDVNDDRARRILLADNRTSDTATYDDDLLAELLTDLEDLDGTGYTPADLDALTASIEPPDLDDLADQVGPPKQDDGWPSITMRVPHTVKAAWNSHLSSHGDDPAAALARLLDVDYDPHE